MNQTKLRVDNLFGKKKKDDVKDWKFTSYKLCERFGWDYYTLLEQPIPFIIDMMEMMRFENESKEEQSSNTPKTKRLGRKK